MNRPGRFAPAVAVSHVGADWATELGSKRGVHRGVALRDGDALIGTCGRPTWGSGWAHPPGGPGLAQAARDFEVMRAYRERGHMAEALAAMLRFGFERMGLRRVEAEVAFENRASARPVERVGFHKQAVVASRWSHSKGARHDLWILAPSCHDWSPPAG